MSLAQGRLQRDGPGTEEGSPSLLTPGGLPLEWGREVCATEGRPEEARTDGRAVLQPHITEEGGELLEGRGKQAYESVERRHNETQSSNYYVHRHRQNS